MKKYQKVALQWLLFVFVVDYVCIKYLLWYWHHAS